MIFFRLIFILILCFAYITLSFCISLLYLWWAIELIFKITRIYAIRFRVISIDLTINISLLLLFYILSLYSSFSSLLLLLIFLLYAHYSFKHIIPFIVIRIRRSLVFFSMFYYSIDFGCFFPRTNISTAIFRSRIWLSTFTRRVHLNSL